MKGRHPRKRGRFCYTRIVLEGSVVYRLFRRDQYGKVYASTVALIQPMPREQMAELINQARHTLRDRVDAIDLKAMGVL